MKQVELKIQVIDQETKQILMETNLETADKAYEFAAQMEELGLSVEVHNPTLTQTLSNALGKSEAELKDYEQSLEDEIESHESSCCFEDAQ